MEANIKIRLDEMIVGRLWSLDGHQGCGILEDSIKAYE